MRIILASLVAAGLALSSGAAMAQSASLGGFDGIDTDRNGLVSWAEFNLVYSDVNEGVFNQADADGDGALSLDEFDNLMLATGSIQPALPTAPGGVPSSLIYVEPE